MAVSYSSNTQPGLLAQQYPPPLLPKPGKDNARLQKLLKKSAKKKAASQTAQAPAPFRTSLSPVDEASADLEHSDHSTPPRTPETPVYGFAQQPRFNVRPLRQHAPSPYPQRVTTYGRIARFSPQPVAALAYVSSIYEPADTSYKALPCLLDSPVPGASTQAVASKTPESTSSVPHLTVPASQVTKAAPSEAVETFSQATKLDVVSASHVKPRSPVPALFTAHVSQDVIRPLTVLAPLIKPKSPRPSFNANETSRSPKPMFDVPKIRLYTANTSYYETSRTPPMYDSAGLTYIGCTVTTSRTPTLEINRAVTPTSEVKRGLTPTSEIKICVTPIGETIPTTEMKTDPTPEIKRSLTPTLEAKSNETPISETIKTKITVASESAVSTTPSGRPKTPSHHVTRAKTPVFEISRPNPLLFAVSPVTVETERSRTPTQDSAAAAGVSTAQPTTEPKSTKSTLNDEITLNGDVHSNVTPVEPPMVKSVQESVAKSAPAEKESPQTEIAVKTPTGSFDSTSEVHLNQVPIMPTYSTSNATAPAPPSYGYQRPKTPIYGSSTTPAIQRPKTPTYTTPKTKSLYRGLTPAEYVAHGGIQSYSPAFGLSRSKTPTQEDGVTTTEDSAQHQTSTQGIPVKTDSSVEVSKVKDGPIVVDRSHVKDDNVASLAAVVVPAIVISQTSDASEATVLSRETSKASSQVSDTKVIKAQTAQNKEIKTETKETVKTPLQEVVKSTPAAKTKSPLPAVLSKGETQAPLLEKLQPEVKKTVQAATQAAVTQSKTSVLQQKVSIKPSAATEVKTEGIKPSPLTPSKVPALEKTVIPIKALAKPAGEADKAKEETTVPVPVAQSGAAEKKEQEDALPEATALLQVIKKPKGMKSKLSGWSRLKKHMVVEQEEPKFPELGIPKKAASEDQGEVKKVEQTTAKVTKAPVGEDDSGADNVKATQMWDAVLFQMFSTKENIMHQIELNKSEEEKKKEKKDEPKEIPAFAHRLPVLLFSPKFDAKRLREAASRPLTKISTVFEMGLIGRKNKDEEPKDFNRTAKGFSVP